MQGVLSELLKAGPAYLLAAVLLAILVWDRRAAIVAEKARAKRAEARDKRLDVVADMLYEVAMKSVARDEQVHGTLEAVRRDVEEVRRRTAEVPTR